MRSSTTTLTAADGTELAVYRWLPDEGTDPKAVVQIAHGMAEHAGRYARFAEALTAAGYAVYANDHRGHGRTAGSPHKLGHVADSDGWDVAVHDLVTLSDQIRIDHPGLPLFLFGHSAGSLLSRWYAIEHEIDLAGLVLSATSGDPGVMALAGRVLANVQARIQGKRTPSPLLDNLSFGSFNRQFDPTRTKFDWLSRDPAEVDAYIDDPYCGFVMSTRFYCDLLDGVARVNSDAHVSKVRHDLPILLFAGAEDPVGGNTKGVQEVCEQYRRAGVIDVTCRFYPGARHETLNETNRDEVMADVIAWLDAHLSGAPSAEALEAL